MLWERGSSERVKVGRQSWKLLQLWNLEDWNCCLGSSPAGREPQAQAGRAELTQSSSSATMPGHWGHCSVPAQVCVCPQTLLPLLAEQARVSSFSSYQGHRLKGSSIRPGLTALCYPATRAACWGCCSDSRGLQDADPGQKAHEVLHFSPPLLPCDLLFNCFVSSKKMMISC